MALGTRLGARVPTVLSIDDDREMLRSIKRVLHKEQFKLITFSDPDKLLSHVSDKRVDVVLSDIDMPQMNGLDLLRQVKLIRPDAVRVVVSGVRDIDAAVRAINEGAVHRFVRKPFDPDDLREAVRDALAQAATLRGDSGPSAVEAWCERVGELDLKLTEVPRDGKGAYLLDVKAAEELAPELGLEHILRVFHG